MADDTVTIPVQLAVPRQALLDLLVTAVEGGSNYWADFSEATRDGDLNYVRIRVRERGRHDEFKPAYNGIVDAEHLARGIAALLAYPKPFETAYKHAMDAIDIENHDATTADVVLQMTIFGDLIYG